MSSLKMGSENSLRLFRISNLATVDFISRQYSGKPDGFEVALTGGMPHAQNQDTPVVRVD